MSTALETLTGFELSATVLPPQARLGEAVEFMKNRIGGILELHELCVDADSSIERPTTGQFVGAQPKFGDVPPSLHVEQRDCMTVVSRVCGGRLAVASIAPVGYKFGPPITTFHPLRDIDGVYDTLRVEVGSVSGILDSIMLIGTRQKSSDILEQLTNPADRVFNSLSYGVFHAIMLGFDKDARNILAKR